jgi:hypothetical protein
VCLLNPARGKSPTETFPRWTDSYDGRPTMLGKFGGPSWVEL